MSFNAGGRLGRHEDLEMLVRSLQDRVAAMEATVGVLAGEVVDRSSGTGTSFSKVYEADEGLYLVYARLSGVSYLSQSWGALWCVLEPSIQSTHLQIHFTTYSFSPSVLSVVWANSQSQGVNTSGTPSAAAGNDGNKLTLSGSHANLRNWSTTLLRLGRVP